MKTKPHSSEIFDWLKLAGADGIGPVTFSKLITKFGSVSAALAASVGDLMQIEGIGSATAEKIAATRDNFSAEAELRLADKLGVCIINLEDSRYPAALKQIYDPPVILYFKGTLEKSDNLSIAIVGSRRCSLYGSEQASRFAHILASSGFTIVSGMARGIDSAAHRGALTASGRTLAIQGCGLAKIFPSENKKLFEQIAESGACISELPLNYEPLSENFPSRNRIIAGLSLSVIVVEASERSGALITARAAMENNREVMAVPGKIDSAMSKGTNRLIKDGAKLIDSVEDIIESLGYLGQGLKEHINHSAEQAEEKLQAVSVDISQLKLSDNEKSVYNSLNREPAHIEEIINQTTLQAGAINASLISLRLKGIIKQLPGNMFTKR